MASEFILKRRVQFVDTDLAGVLHFSNYYRLMEEVECAFWRSLGMSTVGRDPDPQVSWPRVSSSCEYLSPARFEEELDLALSIVEIGETSISWAVEFRRGSERIARGRMTSVCCAMTEDGFGPTAIPEAIRSKLTVHHAQTQ
jgi:YbgC/YbaW family acyl-CoA thioester hydrolase